MKQESEMARTNQMEQSAQEHKHRNMMGMKSLGANQ